MRTGPRTGSGPKHLLVWRLIRLLTTWKNVDAVVSDQSSPEIDNDGIGKNTMLESWKWII